MMLPGILRGLPLLNAITIKDKFSILAVEELLDDHCGACVFSKPDLCSEYYQVRMNLDDVPKTTFWPL